ncbi:hypothetical protein E6C76_17710 [Pseudothauera nasutitermitis]|uniref:HTH crp-type domain-containing protein n=1 Tax=Pseudothauera nasutitermitis TaxID=2565930 RepID=A0A4S4AUJ8_9RHOO|nr:hypothetical protein E6C76_17710 [Pseudothauera nasutitermitis]
MTPTDRADKRSDDATRAEAQRVFRSVALLLARYEVRNLKRIFEEFERDILLPILLGEIALHNLGELENGKEVSARPLDRDEPCDTRSLRPCNAYSIAAATGLPRETVRRKIARLIELGWINRRHNGHLYVSSEALAKFGELLYSRELPELLAIADRARRLMGR